MNTISKLFLLVIFQQAIADCQIDQFPNLNFGNYRIQQLSPNCINDTLVLNCTGNTATIGIDLGQNASGGVRRLKMPGEKFFLLYNVYQDSGYRQNWGNTPTDSYNLKLDPLTKTYSIPIYACVGGGQFAAAGVYTDSLLLSVSTN